VGRPPRLKLPKILAKDGKSTDVEWAKAEARLPPVFHWFKPAESRGVNQCARSGHGPDRSTCDLGSEHRAAQEADF